MVANSSSCCIVVDTFLVQVDAAVLGVVEASFEGVVRATASWVVVGACIAMVGSTNPSSEVAYLVPIEEASTFGCSSRVSYLATSVAFADSFAVAFVEASTEELVEVVLVVEVSALLVVVPMVASEGPIA